MKAQAFIYSIWFLRKQNDIIDSSFRDLRLTDKKLAHLISSFIPS